MLSVQCVTSLNPNRRHRIPHKDTAAGTGDPVGQTRTRT